MSGDAAVAGGLTRFDFGSIIDAPCLFEESRSMAALIVIVIAYGPTGQPVSVSTSTVPGFANITLCEDAILQFTGGDKTVKRLAYCVSTG